MTRINQFMIILHVMTSTWKRRRLESKRSSDYPLRKVVYVVEREEEDDEIFYGLNGDDDEYEDYNNDQNYVLADVQARILDSLSKLAAILINEVPCQNW
ncbi:Uncharacterized protein TCM_040461 [Theobroma cacao]|uniref:Uncharacterized protein n=1 Tax=Theobroma cacao TaxID=3641 RepID=A0A061GSV1_THECC|nr:Uncharacterized protein TCM_040461 [Theobroma cacao]